MGFTRHWTRFGGEIDEASWALFAERCRSAFRLGHSFGIEFIGNVTADAVTIQGGGETFWLHRTFEGYVPHPEGGCYAFCKTHMQPYDILALTCLLLAEDAGFVRDITADEIVGVDPVKRDECAETLKDAAILSVNDALKSVRG